MGKQQKGFTLLEILVVISIIGFITSISLAYFSSARTKSRDTKRIADFKQLATALDIFYTKYSEYPCGSIVTPGGITQTDGDWLHTHTPTDSFMDAVPTNGTICSLAPTFGLVTDKIVRYGIHDPSSDINTAYVYEVSNDRQSYILYTILESNSNAAKMANDGGFSSCFYEVGSGVGKITPYWLCI